MIPHFPLPSKYGMGPQESRGSSEEPSAHPGRGGHGGPPLRRRQDAWKPFRGTPVCLHRGSCVVPGSVKKPEDRSFGKIPGATIETGASCSRPWRPEFRGHDTEFGIQNREGPRKDHQHIPAGAAPRGRPGGPSGRPPLPVVAGVPACEKNARDSRAVPEAPGGRGGHEHAGCGWASRRPPSGPSLAAWASMWQKLPTMVRKRRQTLPPRSPWKAAWVAFLRCISGRGAEFSARNTPGTESAIIEELIPDLRRIT